MKANDQDSTRHGSNNAKQHKAGVKETEARLKKQKQEGSDK